MLSYNAKSGISQEQENSIISPPLADRNKINHRQHHKQTKTYPNNDFK